MCDQLKALFVTQDKEAVSRNPLPFAFCLFTSRKGSNVRRGWEGHQAPGSFTHITYQAFRRRKSAGIRSRIHSRNTCSFPTLNILGKYLLFWVCCPNLGRSRSTTNGMSVRDRHCVRLLVRLLTPPLPLAPVRTDLVTENYRP